MAESASNRNEYQEYSLGVKTAGEQGWQPYHLHVTIVLKTGSLNLLEPSGPVQGLLYLYHCKAHGTTAHTTHKSTYGGRERREPNQPL